MILCGEQILCLRTFSMEKILLGIVLCTGNQRNIEQFLGRRNSSMARSKRKRPRSNREVPENRGLDHGLWMVVYKESASRSLDHCLYTMVHRAYTSDTWFQNRKLPILDPQRLRKVSSYLSTIFTTITGLELKRKVIKDSREKSQEGKVQDEIFR